MQLLLSNDARVREEEDLKVTQKRGHREAATFVTTLLHGPMSPHVQKVGTFHRPNSVHPTWAAGRPDQPGEGDLNVKTQIGRSEPGAAGELP